MVACDALVFPFPIPHSPFPILHSRFPIPDLRFTIHESPLCYCLTTLTDAVAALPLASSARAEIVEFLFFPLGFGTLQL